MSWLGLPGPKLEKPFTDSYLAKHFVPKAWHIGLYLKKSVWLATAWVDQKPTTARQAGHALIRPVATAKIRTCSAKSRHLATLVVTPVFAQPPLFTAYDCFPTSIIYYRNLKSFQIATFPRTVFFWSVNTFSVIERSVCVFGRRGGRSLACRRAALCLVQFSLIERYARTCYVAVYYVGRHRSLRRPAAARVVPISINHAHNIFKEMHRHVIYLLLHG